MDYMDEALYYTPQKCPKCGEQMTYKGLGEYLCENCNIREYDDYGKVRNYIDAHKGATAPEVEAATGVSQRAIRKLLKEERIAVAHDSKVFLKCERCGTDILSGRYCAKCASQLHATLDKPVRHDSNLSGFGKKDTADDGAIRFKRTK